MECKFSMSSFGGSKVGFVGLLGCIKWTEPLSVTSVLDP